MDRSAFFKHLRRSHQLSQQQIEVAAMQPPDSDQAHALARALIAQGLLSRFQARQLLADESQGLLLGPYRLLSQIGKEGTSRTVKALSTATSRFVALKLLASDGSQTQTAAALKLDHPNIVTTYDSDQIEGVRFLAREYIDGLSLEEVVKQHGPLPVELACEVMYQAAHALQHAHERGVVHSAIKPANLLIMQTSPRQPGPANGDLLAADFSSRPLVKVSDFALAQPVRFDVKGTDKQLVEDSISLDAADYLAPEQAQEDSEGDRRSDLYSLGCTFYFALTGRPPFTGNTVLDKMSKHLLKKPDPLTEHCPDVPSGVAAIVQRLLAKDPNQRFQTPAELIRELAPWCGGLRPEPHAEKSVVDSIPETATAKAAVSGHAPQADTASFQVPLEEELLQPPRLGTKPLDPALLPYLRQWLAVIKLFAHGKGARQRVSPRVYQELYDRLLTACRAQAGDAEADSWRYFWKLGELVRPWMTVEALAGANRDVLCDLLNRCQQVEQQLGGKRWRPSFKGWSGPLVVLGMLLFLAGVAWSVNHFVYPFAEQAYYLFGEYWSSLYVLLDFQWWIVGGVVLALLMMFVVSRTART